MSEQKHPAGEPGVWKKPNFGLIVALSAVVILVVLIAAYFFARKDSRDVVPKIRQGSLSIPSDNPVLVDRSGGFHTAST